MVSPFSICSRELAVITGLFVLWGFALNLNDILVPHLKKSYDLSDMQSALIQTSYFGAYFLAALPAGAVMRLVGYKLGIRLALLVCAFGCVSFYPSSQSVHFAAPLCSVFILASGAAALEVAANAYVVQLGDADTSEMRLNLVQTFNAIGGAAAPLVGRHFILSGVELTPAQTAAMTAPELAAYRAGEAAMVQWPYLALGGMFLGIAGIVHCSPLPPVEDKDAASGTLSYRETLSRLTRHTHFVHGVAALFVYVGAQVGVSSFLIRYVQVTSEGAIGERTCADLLFAHFLLFLIGRMAGTSLMTRYAPAWLLQVFAACACTLCLVCVLGSGNTAIFAVVAIGFCNSIMFPTIFSLSVRGLGDLTKPASAVLIMAIVGGAVVPAVMGLVSDTHGIRSAFGVLVVCYLAVARFALSAAPT